ncbi:MAG: CsbD family protein [Planctomycetota bacterium]|nr:CsbD family protein [Planctomycetota bacterium]
MTLNIKTVQESWDEVKAKICDRWDKITDRDIQQTRGSVEQLIGMIQLRTGESRSAVVSYLESTVSGGSTLMTSLTDYYHATAETMRDTAQNTMQSIRAGYEEAEEFVEGRPMESVAVSFGAGFIAGAILTCLVGSSRHRGR